MSSLTSMETQIISEMRNRFNHRAPNDAHAAVIREALLAAATAIALHTRFSRAQDVALTKLEEAMFWANAAIAREQ